MVQAGILNGYSDGTFKPNASITRAEFATIAARFLSNPYSTKDRFYDTEGHWAEVYINRAAEIGWIGGYPDGSFKPDQYITRAEAVTLVNNVLGRAPHADYMLDDMIRWPDNPSLPGIMRTSRRLPTATITDGAAEIVMKSGPSCWRPADYLT